eukprot:1741174-Amphidinium_carterae.2
MVRTLDAINCRVCSAGPFGAEDPQGTALRNNWMFPFFRSSSSTAFAIDLIGASVSVTMTTLG